MPIFNAKQKAKETAKILASKYNMKYNPDGETFSIYAKGDDSGQKGRTGEMVDADRRFPNISRGKHLVTEIYLQMAEDQRLADVNSKKIIQENAANDLEKDKVNKGLMDAYEAKIAGLTTTLSEQQKKIEELNNLFKTPGDDPKDETTTTDVPTDEPIVMTERQKKLKAGANTIAKLSMDLDKKKTQLLDALDHEYRYNRTSFWTQAPNQEYIDARERIEKETESNKNLIRDRVWKELGLAKDVQLNFRPAELVMKNSTWAVAPEFGTNFKQINKNEYAGPTKLYDIKRDWTGFSN